MRELLHAFHVRFASWINFQNESFLIKIMHALFLISQSDTNQGPSTFEAASLPSDLSMFSIHRLKSGPFVCKCMTYLQSLIYFQTELLTRAKFIRHVWTGFWWSHRWWKVVLSQHSVNIMIRNWINPSVLGFAILLALSSGSMGVSCSQDSLVESRLCSF